MGRPHRRRQKLGHSLRRGVSQHAILCAECLAQRRQQLGHRRLHDRRQHAHSQSQSQNSHLSEPSHRPRAQPKGRGMCPPHLRCGLTASSSVTLAAMVHCCRQRSAATVRLAAARAGATATAPPPCPTTLEPLKCTIAAPTHPSVCGARAATAARAASGALRWRHSSARSRSSLKATTPSASTAVAGPASDDDAMAALCRDKASACTLPMASAEIRAAAEHTITRAF